ncbi:acyl-CoA synthetase [Marinobacter halodurans]|uniref:Acyl-CoA synthetase n=1 Tax=Marinobacter halodurans TaxID=2528979 RepID=A0ABY1ZPG4_9GAMM|nr:AMP-binding protein [Marinobacter halodurans]TBW58741.1 acyl-CoA synthetase [Marinobacter halodurans]
MDFLGFQASIRPDTLAVEDLTFDRRWTYAAFDRFVSQVASDLGQRGIGIGDRVAVLSKNRAELIALHLACARCGALFVPLNWRLSRPEIDVLLADCEPALFFGDSLAGDLGLAHEPIDNLFDSAQNQTPMAPRSLDKSLPSLILYTSGTTGTPKGVLHTEASILETTINASLVCQVDAASVFLCDTPMFHTIGLITCVRPALYNGGRLAVSDGFEPERTLSRLEDARLGITHYFCVPQMANALRQVPDFEPSRLGSLKGLLTGGSLHPEPQIRAWLKDGIPIVDGYGMSEAGTVFGMPFELDLIDRKAGSVGVPSHRIEARLANASDEPLPDGMPGEVQLRGDNLAVGFWGREQAFRDCFTADGWYRTGDIAIRDADGFYRIVDRKKDMFISGGENVFPAEVEAVVLTQPEVLECALVGMPDERWGEVGCLFVVPRHPEAPPTPEAILAGLDGQLARYKLPKKVVILDELPKSATGKVLKRALRQ